MATLKDLLASGMSRDEINALLSQGTVGTEGFQQSGFMGGEPYMPPPQAEPQQPPRFSVGEDGLSRMTDRPGEVEQAPMNTIRNNSTGVVTQMPSSGQRSHDVWADGPQEIGRYQLANGRTEIIRKIPVMRDGRQSVGMERLIETPDYLNPTKLKQLEYQKREAEVRNLNARQIVETPQQKLANELIAAEARSKLPYTPEGTRLAAIKLEEEKAKIGKALPSPAVTSLSAAGASVEDTSRSMRNFKDEYGGKTVMGRLSNTIGKLVGDETGQVQWWQDYDSAQNLARNALFGSALTQTEKDAWEMIAVNPRMNPGEIRKNIERKQALEARAASKLGRAYSAGGYSKDQIKELLGDAATYLESGAPPVTDPSNNASGAVKVNSVNEAMKLKSGTRFIDPNGVERVRP